MGKIINLFKKIFLIFFSLIFLFLLLNNIQIKEGFSCLYSKIYTIIKSSPSSISNQVPINFNNKAKLLTSESKVESTQKNNNDNHHIFIQNISNIMLTQNIVYGKNIYFFTCFFTNNELISGFYMNNSIADLFFCLKNKINRSIEKSKQNSLTIVEVISDIEEKSDLTAIENNSINLENHEKISSNDANNIIKIEDKTIKISTNLNNCHLNIKSPDDHIAILDNKIDNNILETGVLDTNIYTILRKNNLKSILVTSCVLCTGVIGVLGAGYIDKKNRQNIKVSQILPEQRRGATKFNETQTSDTEQINQNSKPSNATNSVEPKNTKNVHIYSLVTIASITGLIYWMKVKEKEKEKEEKEEDNKDELKIY